MSGDTEQSFSVEKKANAQSASLDWTVARDFGRYTLERYLYESMWYLEPGGCLPWNWRSFFSQSARTEASTHWVEVE